MWINSPDVGADGQLAAAQAWNADGCGGANRSPALRWGGETPATRGFALVMMDVESRKGFRQWLVFNIPAGVHSLPAGAGQPDGKALPAGAVQSENDYGAPGYGGPCPPAGETHHYTFTIYALNQATLDLSPNQRAGSLETLVLSHALGKGRMMARGTRVDAPPDKKDAGKKEGDGKEAGKKPTEGKPPEGKSGESKGSEAKALPSKVEAKPPENRPDAAPAAAPAAPAPASQAQQPSGDAPKP
ncbi:MAG: YbhB/YbcL family Raf kinase inhibitor-like protein [Azospirillaceae bacterium]|nr:YbhB/YbcL family Raf kinase inhibitor-like protein [Azospirillaceae bacterium]